MDWSKIVSFLERYSWNKSGSLALLALAAVPAAPIKGREIFVSLAYEQLDDQFNLFSRLCGHRLAPK